MVRLKNKSPLQYSPKSKYFSLKIKQNNIQVETQNISQRPCLSYIFDSPKRANLVVNTPAATPGEASRHPESTIFPNRRPEAANPRQMAFRIIREYLFATCSFRIPPAGPYLRVARSGRRSCWKSIGRRSLIVQMEVGRIDWITELGNGECVGSFSWLRARCRAT